MEALVDIRDIGSKDFHTRVNRYRKETYLARVASLALIIAYVAFLNVILLMTSLSWQAILSAVLFDTAVLALYLLALFASMKLIFKALGLTHEFEGEKEDLARIREVAEEISLAFGIKPVELLFINEEKLVPNAFSFKRYGRGVIVLNRALWDELNVDELRAVMSHEAAHIYTGDAGNSTLVAPFELMNNYKAIHPEKPRYLLHMFMVIIIFLPLIAVVPCSSAIQNEFPSVNLGFGTLVLGVIFFAIIALSGELLTSIHGKSREYLADALAMQWTMNPGLNRCHRKSPRDDEA